MSPITLTTNIEDFTKSLRGLPEYADRLLFETVKDGLDYGQRRMREIVPVGKGDLASAVLQEMNWTIGSGHYEGSVYVNPFIAPHARFVDEGTGVDGPFGRPVTITRPSHSNPNKPGMMRFEKNGEETVFRRTVKIHPSAKIERGKNFSGRTYESMKHWTALRVAQVTSRLAAHLAGHK